MIPFSVIPNNYRLPLFFAEVNNSNANTSTQNQRTLIIGQSLGAGSAPVNEPVQIAGLVDAQGKCGAGSQIARAVEFYRMQDPTGELWALPVADAGGSVAATGSINFTAAPTAQGVISLYIGGRLCSTAVTSTMTVDEVATAVAASINAIPNVAVSAAVDGVTLSQVDLTALNAGPIGNDIDIRFNYLGDTGAQVTPPGLTFAVVAMTGGATPPVLATALANCGDMPFDFIVLCANDTASLNALDLFLSDLTGRWSYASEVYGHYLTALRGTAGALQTAGLARNGQHGSIMGFYNSPNVCDEWAAATFGAAAVALKADPGRPCQTLAIQGLLAPPVQSLFPATERNTLLFSGIATFTVDPSGTIRIENLITCYQLNAFNQPDNSYLEIETLFLLMFVIRALASAITSKYPRMKLAADGTRFAPGSAIVTPSIVKAEVIAVYQQLEYQGYVQGSDIFAANVIVEQNSGNPNRLDCYWPGILINQLRMFALLAAFQLEVPPTIPAAA